MSGYSTMSYSSNSLQSVVNEFYSTLIKDIKAFTFKYFYLLGYF
jgi:hypothetical protein